VAGGLEIALACDLIVAARGAKLGIPEVKRSLVAAGGALLRLPQRVPYGVAMELALTGDPIDAERAAQIGLVDRLPSRAARVDAAIELARRSPQRAARAHRDQAGPPAAARLERGAFWASRARSPGRSSPPTTPARARSPSPRKRDPQWTGT
jgi:enoyl-CoA hydratase